MQSYTSPEKREQLYKRTLLIVVISQVFGGAGLAAGVTVGALLAEEMLGASTLAGMPMALFTLGSAAAALIVGRMSQRFGRRLGLGAGFIVGGIGSIGVVLGALYGHVFLLFASLFIYGSGTATNLQARYAGTDLASSTRRGRAVSIAMVSTTLGAVAGPNLVDVTGRVATSFGIPALAGPFMLAAAAYILAGLVLLLLLRPDPLIVARAVMAAQGAAGPDNRGTPTGGSGGGEQRESVRVDNTNRQWLFVGATVMFMSHLVMVAIMTMTPVHMGHFGHSLQAVGVVIGMHIAAMYLPSPLTGMLVDKIGRTSMVVLGGLTLLASGLMAAFVPGHSLPLITIALVLLGLGWNFGFITGTTIVTDAADPATRARTQGAADVLVALAGALGGALSGVIVARSGYATLAVAGGLISLVLIPAVLSVRNKDKEKIADPA